MHPGAPLRGALTPDCTDTGAAPGPATAVGAWQIDGVSPAVAIASQGYVYAASGYFPDAAGFPLERPGPGAADETRGCQVGEPLTIDGTADVRFSHLSISHPTSSRPVPLTRGRLTQLILDGHTQIAGLDRDGAPFIGPGQRLHIEAVPCQVRGASEPEILARRITPAGPPAGPGPAAAVLGADWKGGANRRGFVAHPAVLLVLIAGGAIAAVAAVARRA
jgi:hypothetical protein